MTQNDKFLSNNTINTNRFITAHAHDNVEKLALKYAFNSPPDVDILFALNQIAGRQIAEVKIPSWAATEGLIFPPRLALEQCSSEATAQYKAALLSGGSFVDLTGGFGIDFAFISRNFTTSVYVERQEELCWIAEHNFNELDLHGVSIVNRDCIEYLRTMPSADAIFIDPARRSSSGRKMVSVGDCQPDVAAIQSLLTEKSPVVLVKLSPMLDIANALTEIRNVAEVHVVGCGGECKELLLVVKRGFEGEAEIVAAPSAPIGQRWNFRLSDEKDLVIDYTTDVSEYLYEPDATLLKAGCFKLSTVWFSVRKLHPVSHLYTSEKFIENFPGRCFKVERCSSFGKSDLKSLLSGVSKANITVRNFPATVAELRRRLKIADGGEIYLFATTMADGRKTLISSRKMTSRGLSPA
jgi:hypothetical protein